MGKKGVVKVERAGDSGEEREGGYNNYCTSSFVCKLNHAHHCAFSYHMPVPDEGQFV